VPRSQRYTRNLGRARIEPAPPGKPEARYVRFEHPTEKLGLFRYTEDLRRALDRVERQEVVVLMEWFNDNLEVPSRMVPYRPVGRRAARYRWAETTAICWFRQEATEHVSRARRLAVLVRSVGIPIVERRVTRIPGKLCSEDEFQIAVQAFRDARVTGRRG
jgi:hypothetical protein